MACFSAAMSLSGVNYGGEIVVPVHDVLVRGSAEKSGSWGSSE